jgi:pimeloyl-ACP methyl ester carboxylesterase
VNTSRSSSFEPPPKSRLQIWWERGLWAILILAVVLLIAGAIYQAIATEVDKRNFPAPGQRVDVGGYSLHIYCTGENIDGSPTVILEQGLGGTSAAWARVQPEIARTTQVCSYDRAGMGWSDASREPRDAEHIAAELNRVLKAAGVPGPYVLVGWSFGGLYARAYAGQFPDEVAGMVLLDSSHPDQWASTEGKAQYDSNAGIYGVAPWLARVGVIRLMGLSEPASTLPAPHGQAMLAFSVATQDWETQSAEYLAATATNDTVRGLDSLGGMPLYVLSATNHGSPPEVEAVWQGWQNDLALLSTNSIHQVVDGANHAAFWLDPENSKTTVAAILIVVNSVRTGQPLAP